MINFLPANLRNQTNCSSFLEETLRQKNEEIAGWKHKFAREEEESFKREQALINGYKAEINNLKTQVSIKYIVFASLNR